MSDRQLYAPEQLMSLVEAMMNVLTKGGNMQAGLSLDALAFVSAVIYDMDPSVTARSHMRQAAEQQGSAVYTYLRHLRRSFEATGRRFGETMGGTVTGTDDVATQLAKGQTKQ